MHNIYTKRSAITLKKNGPSGSNFSSLEGLFMTKVLHGTVCHCRVYLAYSGK